MYKKKFVKIALVVVGVLLAIYLIFTSKAIWESYQWQKSVDKWQEASEKPYKEDVYGGKTPEETWGMFLTALKDKDIELASKYFFVDRQEEWRKIFDNTVKAGNIDLVIKNLDTDLRKEKNSIQEEKAYFYYDIKNEQTDEVYTNSVVFYLNTYTNVWKILSL